MWTIRDGGCVLSMSMRMRLGVWRGREVFATVETRREFMIDHRSTSTHGMLAPPDKRNSTGLCPWLDRSSSEKPYTLVQKFGRLATAHAWQAHFLLHADWSSRSSASGAH